MHIEALREYCIAKKGVTEEFPFNEVTLVFKVMGKMFVMVPLDRWEQEQYNVILKLDPEEALELRASHEQVIGGFQQGRQPNARFVHDKFWNTVVTNTGLPDSFAFELIDRSYEEVIKGLTKKLRTELENS